MLGKTLKRLSHNIVNTLGIWNIKIRSIRNYFRNVKRKISGMAYLVCQIYSSSMIFLLYQGGAE